MKWKPPADKLKTSIQSVAEVVVSDEIPLTHQVYFLQSAANLEYLKASSSSRAYSLLIGALAELKQQNCWTKAFACCLIKTYVKQLDFTEPDIESKLSDINDILKRSLAETSGLKE